MKSGDTFITHIRIFQADYEELYNRDLFFRLHSPNTEPVSELPADIYNVVFDSDIQIPTPESTPQSEDMYILARAFQMFNIAHPTGYRGRSMSVGDVVEVHGTLYLCTSFSFTPVNLIKPKGEQDK